MLIAHNPGLEETIGWLSGASIALKTAAVAVLTATADSWHAAVAAPGGFAMQSLLQPRDLRD
jgi:phosphohistidine phosphatase SixA